jgi:hypothetical protein
MIVDTGFLNVDLEIFSKRDLQPLINALGEKVLILYSAREGRTYRAHLELARTTRTPDAAIRAFCGLIERLPKAARYLWNQAKRRDFNIGVEGGTSSRQPREFAVSTGTLKAAHRLGARIAFTVYAPEKPQKGRRNIKRPTDLPD